MKSLARYKLISDLFSSIIIFNADGGIILAGDSITNTLKINGIDIEKIVDDRFGSLEGKRLISYIQTISRDRYIDSYQFDKFDLDFILFRSSFSGRNCVVLALQQELDQISRIKSDLKERVKELECLYNISFELERFDDVDVKLNKCVEHIREGFQYPEITLVNILLKKKMYGDIPVSEVPKKNFLIQPLLSGTKKIGELLVWYAQPEAFLVEEIDLLKEIAGKITLAIEKRQKKQDLEKGRQVLLLKNKKLFELTEECREKREQLQAFFSAITDNIIVIDPRFNIIMSNSEEIGESGKCYKKLFGANDICDHCPALNTFTRAEPSSLEKAHEDKDFRLFTYPILDKENQVSSVLEVCRDITQQKMMEAQLLQSYKLASLGKLVTGVAHEINNPNTFILGNIKIIREAISDILPILDRYYQDQPELYIARLPYNVFKDNITILIDDMVSGSIRMKKIVEDLRNFAKKDDDLQFENIQLNSLIENSVRLIKKQVKKSVKIKLDLAGNIPVFLGRNAKIQQVLVNIIINASQAMDKKTGLIEISTHFLKDQESVRINITDNGRGMSEKTQKYIFDPFFTTRRNSGGTGLGLSITYGIMKEHQGTITVDSKRGVGTRFSIYFPVKQQVK